eukprot:493238_1
MVSSFHIAHMVVVVVCSISFLIVLLVGIICIKQLSLSKKIDPIFKKLFYVSWSLASIGLLLIFSHSMCHLLINHNCNPLGTLGIILIYSCAFNLLLILIYRLYFSFKGSIFAISETTKYILITLYCIILLLLLTIVIAFIYLQIKAGWDNIVSIKLTKLELNTSYYVMVCNMVTIPIYIVTTIITIIIFAKKLLKLTNFRRNSVAAIKPAVNLKQIKVIDNATRYVSLLSMGIFSSTSCCVMVIVLIWWFIGKQYINKEYVNIVFAIICIDCVINIIGLYLQFAFACKYYNKYCKRIHLCWRYLLIKQVTRELMKNDHGNKIKSDTDTTNNKLRYDHVTDHFSDDDDELF